MKLTSFEHWLFIWKRLNTVFFCNVANWRWLYNCYALQCVFCSWKDVFHNTSSNSQMHSMKHNHFTSIKKHDQIHVDDQFEKYKMSITINAQKVYKIEITMLWIALLDLSWSKLLWNFSFNFVTFSPTCQKWINGIIFLKITSYISCNNQISTKH
jgi:hypothetical protein